MSVRPRPKQSEPTASASPPRSSSIDLLRQIGKGATGTENVAEVAYDTLNPVEQAVVELKVEPNALKPIEWLNAAHYDGLKKNNSLSDDLQRRIEAHRYVASTAGS